MSLCVWGLKVGGGVYVLGGWVHVMCLCGVHVSLCKKFVYVDVSLCRCLSAGG